MAIVRELYAFLEECFPRSLSCAWDNDGMMCCGDSTKEVHRVLCALDVTEKTIAEAVDLGCDCIVSHHPMIFQKMASVSDGDFHGRRVIDLLSHGIAVMSFHTRLDAVQGGVNDVLCKTLGLTVTGTFGCDGEEIGRIAVPDAELNLQAFCSRIKSALGTPCVHAVSAKRPVSRVAVLGGDGKDDWEAALEAGEDTYVTGTMSYNTLLDAKAAGLNVIAAGHFYTEAPVMAAVAEKITSAFEGVGAVVSE
ncbi:MAG: Nif3-like dinuclear metal center hexameric protein [Clostridia bacterium]|nr:Nif3-like dinuclear metal center hexameric protein [Clostridia bacterium]